MRGGVIALGYGGIERVAAGFGHAAVAGGADVAAQAAADVR